MRNITLGLLVGIGMYAASLSEAVALTPEEIDAVASQVTVVIAQGLSPNDTDTGLQPGSGVLVAREGSTHFVLTAFHVVSLSGVSYGIRTSDNAVHVVGEENVTRLGRYDNTCLLICGTDLALVRFNSDKLYPVVSLADPGRLPEGTPLYVSGWPDPGESVVGRNRVTSPGSIRHMADIPSVDGAYSMLYDSQTQRGMSGGPILNSDGQLVGIHGRGRGIENNCSNFPDINANNSCGIEMFYFLPIPEIRLLGLRFNTSPVDPVLIMQGFANLSTADRVDNIFEIFSNQQPQVDGVQQQIREMEEMLDQIRSF